MVGLTRILTDVGGSVVKYNMVPGGGDVKVGTFLKPAVLAPGLFSNYATHDQGQGLDKQGQ